MKKWVFGLVFLSLILVFLIGFDLVCAQNIDSLTGGLNEAGNVLNNPENFINQQWSSFIKSPELKAYILNVEDFFGTFNLIFEPLLGINFSFNWTFTLCLLLLIFFLVYIFRFSSLFSIFSVWLKYIAFFIAVFFIIILKIPLIISELIVSYIGEINDWTMQLIVISAIIIFLFILLVFSKSVEMALFKINKNKENTKIRESVNKTKKELSKFKEEQYKKDGLKGSEKSEDEEIEEEVRKDFEGLSDED